MFINFVYGALFSLMLIGCAGEPVRVHLSPTHPADRRAEEAEFWSIPNPFAGMPEITASDTPAGQPDEGVPSPHHGHGHHPGMPEGQRSSGASEQPHHMQQHGQ